MNNTQIIIYCGGKCGSATLEKTFIKNNYKTIRTHGYIPEIDNLQNTLYIIDSYRDPIERKISSFFQNIHIHLCKKMIDINKLPTEELIKIFNNTLLLNLENYHPLDIEHPIFKNDNFNFSNEYILKKIDNKIYIKLRFKSINNWNLIFKNIFNKNIPIYNNNLSQNKIYNKIYYKFKKEYKIPISVLNYIYKFDKLFQKYNTIDEKQKYYNQWLINSYEDNNMFNIPSDFDPNKYLEINNDLQINNELDTLLHYLNNRDRIYL
jgi:hypothetical protein